MKRKAIALLSGGLDSVIAIKLMLEQDISVTALHFTSQFSSRREKIQGLQAERSARELNVPLILKDKGPEYIDVIRSPKHGRGKNMNPCIDCRIFMLKKTGEIMEDIGARFIITGEVVGQRPMSQRKDAIQLIERESGLAGLILRPLSATHFPPTVPEEEGIVDRTRLLHISGRSRAIQYELIESFKLTEYSEPGGGCLLTDPIFSVKMRELFQNDKDFTSRDIDLLSMGRHFRIEGQAKLIVGRNERENNALNALWGAPYTLVSPVGFKGPVGILKGEPDEETIALAANIIGRYGKNQSSSITVELSGENIERRKVAAMDIDINGLMI